jgi:transcriptional regulator with XRE-family HTH domain
MDMNDNSTNLGTIIKRQRVLTPLTLQELAAKSGVSASHLGRIERGERFPSAHVLRKIAKPLGFNENDLFTSAGYLPPQSLGIYESVPSYSGTSGLDPYVARVLSQEPFDVQRAVISILTIIKSIARSIAKEG